MAKKYVIFKDDDVGKDLPSFKKWADIVIKNDAKATVGVIGKYLRDKELVEYLNSLDKDRIEIFCHGYSHSILSTVLRRILGRNRLYPTEFDRNLKNHNNTLKKYRDLEKKYLKFKAITFGPQGNVWNASAISALEKHGFKLMFSWGEIKGKVVRIPLVQNYYQNSLEDFKKYYAKHKDKEIFTLQFHHADLTDEQFKALPAVIDFLKNKEKRVFIIPSELLKS